MDHFATFLDVDAAEGHEAQKAVRHASVLFNHRATERFLPFLRQSVDRDEFEARLSLIERDLQRVAAEITDETGHDSAYLVEHYKTVVAGGAFCDNCRKWKSGPKAGLCVCDDEGSDEGSEDDSAEKESRTVEAMPGAPGQGWHGEAQPQGNEVCGHCGQPVDKLSNVDRCPHCGNSTGGPGLDQFGDQLGNKLFGPFQGSTTVPFKIVATNEDSLGGKGKPSPKIDKSNAGDEKSNKKRPPIDTDGGPYKTDHQDVADGPDYTRDFLEQTDAAGEHNVDVEKKSDLKGDHTDTWHGKGDQANPVTSHFLSSEDADRAIEAHTSAEKAQCADCGTKLATKVNEDGIGRCEQCARNVEQAELNEQRDKPPLDK